MAISLNRVSILGNVGVDPEVRSFTNGGKVANLNVATSRTWKDRSGEKQERTEWHRVNVTAEHSVDYVSRYVKKGDRVLIEGRLETRKWKDQSGADRYSTEIVVAPYDGQVIGLGRMVRDDDRGGASGGGSSYSGGASGGQSGGPAGGPDMDDEIPF